MFSKILTPIDGSPLSMSVLPYASRMASQLRIPLVLLSVVEDNDRAPEIERQLDDLAMRGNAEGVNTQVVVARDSKPSEAILRAAKEHGCDVIAIATRDRNPLAQAIQGSVTNDVLKSADIPALAIAPENTAPESVAEFVIGSIIVPLDGSEFALGALPYVENLARRMSLPVMLVSVVSMSRAEYIPYMSTQEPYNPFHSDMAPVTTTGAGAEGRISATQMVFPDGIEAINNHLRDVATGLEAKGVRVSWNILEGDIASAISGLAQSAPGAMIAVASHSRTGIMRWVLGSVSESLIRESGSPVLVIPAAAAERAASLQRTSP